MTPEDSPSNVAAHLTNIEHQLAAAWISGDREFVESTLADDWSVTRQVVASHAALLQQR